MSLGTADPAAVIRLLKPTGAIAFFRNRGMSLEDAQALVEEHVDDAAPAKSGKFAGTAASAVKPEPIEWLWHPWLPLGRLTVLYGEEGIGKGVTAAHIAAQTTLGALDDDEPGPVEWVTYEDGASDVLVPRLIAACAALDQITIHHAGDDYETPLVLPDDVPAFAAAILERGSKLLVIDPLSDALREGLKDNNNGDVRKALVPLQDMARMLNIAVLGVLHPNKGATRAADKIMGSKAWRSVPRSVVLFSKDPADENGPSRIMCLTKTNGAAKKAGVKAHLESVNVDGAGSQAHVVFDGASDLTDDDLTIFAATGRSSESRKPATQVARAEDLIVRLLTEAGGSIKAAVAYAAGAAEEIPEATMKRARANLGIDSQKHVWSVPDDWSPPADM